MFINNKMSKDTTPFIKNAGNIAIKVYFPWKSNKK